MVANARWQMRRLDPPGTRALNSTGTRAVDLAITALVLSVATMAWFGWAGSAAFRVVAGAHCRVDHQHCGRPALGRGFVAALPPRGGVHA